MSQISDKANRLDILLDEVSTIERSIEHNFKLLLSHIIKENEGVSLKAYWDRTRYSIGYGTLSSKDEEISINEAEERFRKSLEESIMTAPYLLSSRVWKILDLPRRAVVIEMVYVLGRFGASRFKKTLEWIEKGNFTQATIELKDSVWFTQAEKRVSSLARRLLYNLYE